MATNRGFNVSRLATAAKVVAPFLLITLTFSPVSKCHDVQHQQQELLAQEDLHLQSHHKAPPPIGKQQNVTTTTTTKSSMQQLTNIWAQQQLHLQHETQMEHSQLEDGSAPATLSASILHAFTRGNNMRAYHLDLHSYRAQAKFVGDPEFVDSKNPQHKSRCQADLDLYRQALESVAISDPTTDKIPLDNIRIADSFGRPEAGALKGGQFWLGSYEQCLDTHMTRSGDGGDDDQTIESQYCLGITQFPNWNPTVGRTSLKVGLCLPVTCTSSMISENSEMLDTVEEMMKYQFGQTKPYDRLKLQEVYCLPHETSQIRQYTASAIGFFVVIGIFVTTCLISTVIDYCNTRLTDNLKPPQERNWRQIIIESFSLTRNLQKFLHVRPESAIIKQQQQVGTTHQDTTGGWIYDKSVFLNSTCGLKCIGLFWIIGAHCFLVGPIVSNNILETDKLTKTYLADIYLAAHLMVDTFFAISGMLAAYFLFKAGINKVSLKQWIVLTIHRYWRLTPIYLLCYWFTKSVGFLVNTGPLWDYMTAEQSPRLNCNRESWFDALLHLSDFKSPKEHCVPFAWFIANGIKFWIVTPIFLILINKSVRQGYMTTISTILTNIVLVATLAMRCDVDVKSVIAFKPEAADNMLNNMGEVYSRPYSRIGAYLVGLLAGHLMYLIDTKQFEVKLSKRTKATIWTLFTVCIILLTFALRLANTVELDVDAMKYVFAISSALIRPIWALCSCWLVFALAHGQAKWLSNFLTANCWSILVKLSFCAYLVQGEVIAQLYLSNNHANSYSYADMISRPIVVTTLTILVSLVMVLTLEYPLIGIEEILLPKRNITPVSDDMEKAKGEKLKQT